MVAKETLTVERIKEHIGFYKSFSETQDLAAYLAEEFNGRLGAIPGWDEKKTPRITFLPCSVLLLEDNEWPGGLRGVLVARDRLSWVL
jgi:hypothetical protein